MELFTGCAPEHIYALLQEGCSGCVEMVNSQGIYLALGEHRVLFCSSRFGVVPNGVSIQQWERLPGLLTLGQSIHIKNMLLELPSGTLRLQLDSIPRDTQLSAPEEGAMRKGVEQLLSKAKETGLSPLVYPLFARSTAHWNPYCEQALPLVQDLLQGLNVGDVPTLRRCVWALLGLGPGLTPSGDDLLCGLLYGLRHSPARDTACCAALTAAIREFAPQQTNGVSADVLLAVGSDASFHRMAAAWKDPAAGAAALLDIGSNSGGEMLLGLLCAGSLYRHLSPQ